MLTKVGKVFTFVSISLILIFILAPLLMIQFDAHLDLVDDSPIQGKYSQSSQMRRALELPYVSPENIVQIGVRSYNYPW